MFAFTVIFVNNDNEMKTDALRITITLPPELGGLAQELSAETGVSLSDLCRQGIIRVISERQETGHVVLKQLPRPELAA